MWKRDNAVLEENVKAWRQPQQVREVGRWAQAAFCVNTAVVQTPAKLPVVRGHDVGLIADPMTTTMNFLPTEPSLLCYFQVGIGVGIIIVTTLSFFPGNKCSNDFFFQRF